MRLEMEHAPSQTTQGTDRNSNFFNHPFYLAPKKVQEWSQNVNNEFIYLYISKWKIEPISITGSHLPLVI